jgi:hypothetical protein
MNPKVREFIDEVRNNWDDHYWWADHQWLMYILLCSILFVYELGTTYFKLRLKLKMTPLGE